MTKEEQDFAIEIYGIGYKDGYEQGVRDVMLNAWDETVWNTPEFRAHIDMVVSGIKECLQKAFQDKKFDEIYTKIAERIEEEFNKYADNFMDDQ